MRQTKDINCLKVVLTRKVHTSKWLAEQLRKDPATVYSVHMFSTRTRKICTNS